MNHFDAVFNREACIRSIAHELWKQGSQLTADQNWLLAESKVQSEPLNITIWTDMDCAYVDKSCRVADVRYNNDNPTVTTSNGKTVRIRRVRLCNTDHLVGDEVNQNRPNISIQATQSSRLPLLS
jgi:hypothetical protein